MKLLPFDLTKAQAGHPWGTRNGRKGKKIFDTEREGGYRLIAVLDDNDDIPYFIDGHFDEGRESANDLLLYEEEKIGWVVISVVNGKLNVNICLNENEKEKHQIAFIGDGTYLQTVEVRY